MSLRLHLASLSLGASVDQQTGSLSVFEVLEEIRAAQLPIQMQAMVISLAFEKTVEAAVLGKLFIHILTPDGNQAPIGSGELQLPADQKRMKAVFRLGGFPINQFGPHRFVVSWTGESGNKEGEALLDFEVIQVQKNNQPPHTVKKPTLAH